MVHCVYTLVLDSVIFSLLVYFVELLTFSYYLFIYYLLLYKTTTLFSFSLFSRFVASTAALSFFFVLLLLLQNHQHLLLGFLVGFSRSFSKLDSPSFLFPSLSIAFSPVRLIPKIPSFFLRIIIYRIETVTLYFLVI